jgi:hypothetical protein
LRRATGYAQTDNGDMKPCRIISGSKEKSVFDTHKRLLEINEKIELHYQYVRKYYDRYNMMFNAIMKNMNKIYTPSIIKRCLLNDNDLGIDTSKINHVLETNDNIDFKYDKNNMSLTLLFQEELENLNKKNAELYKDSKNKDTCSLALNHNKDQDDMADQERVVFDNQKKIKKESEHKHIEEDIAQQIPSEMLNEEEISIQKEKEQQQKMREIQQLKSKVQLHEEEGMRMITALDREKGKLQRYSKASGKFIS